MLNKEYFAVPELLEYWGISVHDILYLLENNIFDVYVRIFGSSGTYCLKKNNDGIPYELPLKSCNLAGLFKISMDNARRVLINQATELKLILSPQNDCDYIRLGSEIDIEIHDLVITRDEKSRLEQDYGFFDSRSPIKAVDTPSRLKDFKMEELPNGYTKFTYLDKEYTFAFIQSAIIKQLYEAAKSGKIWVYGKTLLKNANSSSIRLCEVFKRRTDWTDLIKGNKQGLYRLYLE